MASVDAVLSTCTGSHPSKQRRFHGIPRLRSTPAPGERVLDPFSHHNLAPFAPIGSFVHIFGSQGRHRSPRESLARGYRVAVDLEVLERHAQRARNDGSQPASDRVPSATRVGSGKPGRRGLEVIFTLCLEETPILGRITHRLVGNILTYGCGRPG